MSIVESILPPILGALVPLVWKASRRWLERRAERRRFVRAMRRPE